MARYTTVLKQFDEVATLLKFLYINEEHTVKYRNSMGFMFTLRMDDNGELIRKIDGMETEMMSPEMTHMELIAVIDQLKKDPAEVYPDLFETRWDEICKIYENLLGFNAAIASKRGVII